jgi:hypothetical protein
MHLTIERLLERLAGDGADAGETAHLAGCGRCRSELERLAAIRDELVELAEIGPRRDLWPKIETAMERTRRRGRLRWLAAAAAVALVVAAGLLAVRLSPRPIEIGSGVREIRSNETAEAVREMVAASRELEDLLARPAVRTRVMGPQQAALIVTLEDRIAAVDAVLADPSESGRDERELALWSERVRLLAALVRARAAPSAGFESERETVIRARSL